MVAAEPRSGEGARLLILEPDADVRADMLAVLRESWLGDDADPVCPSGRRVTTIASLRALHACNLREVDLIVCDVALPDGSGLDALAYVRGIRPELPVVLAAPADDVQMAGEAIRAGAIDFMMTSEHDVRLLPLVVEKSLEHRRIKEENDRLQRELSRSLADLELKNQEFEQLIERLELKARTDALTGLANRRWLNLMLEGSWAEAARHDLPLACLMIDLDDLKGLNDGLGHQRGDELLRLTGLVIRSSCREIDIAARYGGDEFCIIMPHTRPDEAVQVAERLLHEFERATGGLPAGDWSLGMSVGVSHRQLSAPAHAQELLLHADEALYAAKSAGKHRVVVRGRTKSRGMSAT